MNPWRAFVPAAGDLGGLDDVGIRLLLAASCTDAELHEHYLAIADALRADVLRNGIDQDHQNLERFAYGYACALSSRLSQGDPWLTEQVGRQYPVLLAWDDAAGSPGPFVYTAAVQQVLLAGALLGCLKRDPASAAAAQRLLDHMAAMGLLPHPDIHCVE